MRTRAPGRDFQEWIKYDIEYVERMNPWLDTWIVWQTVVNILRDLRRSSARRGSQATQAP
jgi:lipopolysaccharide/colanic/teichoic acid biosynthesis glycosyltransferase